MGLILYTCETSELIFPIAIRYFHLFVIEFYTISIRKDMISTAEELLKTAGSDTLRLIQLSRSLQEKLDILTMLDGEIVNFVDERSVADESEQVDISKEGIHSTIVKIEKYSAPPNTLPSDSIAPSRSSADPAPSPRVRLPKLTIKPFNGDLTPWTIFWDSHESSIHKNSSLSDIDRFN